MNDSQFKGAIRQLFNECDINKNGVLHKKNSEIKNFATKLKQKLKFDTISLCEEEIADTLKSLPFNQDQIKFEDFIKTLEDWHAYFKNRKPPLTPRKERLSENQLTDIVKMLLKKNDENKTGGLEFGSEFDNFLYDFMPYTG
jgi:hypothetical protein